MSRCISDQDQDSACEGEVYERTTLSGSGMTFPRCDKHYEEYVARTQPKIDEVRKRYPDSDVPPADFDPMYAGERWNEDDPWP